MNTDTLLLYTLVAFFYVTSPGPAILLSIFNGLRSNMQIVAISSFANVLGLAVLSIASILGLGVVLTTSSMLFMIVKFIGAFYLMYLGIKFIKNNKALSFDDNKRVDKNKTKLSYFLESFFLAVTNPKPILFFTAIFPQFLNLDIDIFPQFTIMTLIFLSISFSSLCVYGLVAKRSKVWLANNNRMT
ncbi:LysE family translocator [Sulfurimonas sp.]|uniref:LysE family translocator n=1 Tax=Sulfurimonas sp. TaxID=2022749 RepID=UPI0025DFE001|nr:LysE family translocator [Sulfurimonas sp.]